MTMGSGDTQLGWARFLVRLQPEFTASNAEIRRAKLAYRQRGEVLLRWALGVLEADRNEPPWLVVAALCVQGAVIAQAEQGTQPPKSPKNLHEDVSAALFPLFLLLFLGAGMHEIRSADGKEVEKFLRVGVKECVSNWNSVMRSWYPEESEPAGVKARLLSDSQGQQRQGLSAEHEGCNRCPEFMMIVIRIIGAAYEDIEGRVWEADLLKAIDQAARGPVAGPANQDGWAELRESLPRLLALSSLCPLMRGMYKWEERYRRLAEGMHATHICAPFRPSEALNEADPTANAAQDPKWTLDRELLRPARVAGGGTLRMRVCRGPLDSQAEPPEEARLASWVAVARTIYQRMEPMKAPRAQEQQQQEQPAESEEGVSGGGGQRAGGSGSRQREEARGCSHSEMMSAAEAKLVEQPGGLHHAVGQIIFDELMRMCPWLPELGLVVEYSSIPILHVSTKPRQGMYAWNPQCDQFLVQHLGQNSGWVAKMLVKNDSQTPRGDTPQVRLDALPSFQGKGMDAWFYSACDVPFTRAIAPAMLLKDGDAFVREELWPKPTNTQQLDLPILLLPSLKADWKLSQAAHLGAGIVQDSACSSTAAAGGGAAAAAPAPPVQVCCSCCWCCPQLSATFQATAPPKGTKERGVAAAVQDNACSSTAAAGGGTAAAAAAPPVEMCCSCCWCRPQLPVTFQAKAPRKDMKERGVAAAFECASCHNACGLGVSRWRPTHEVVCCSCCCWDATAKSVSFGSQPPSPGMLERACAYACRFSCWGFVRGVGLSRWRVARSPAGSAAGSGTLQRKALRDLKRLGLYIGTSSANGRRQLVVASQWGVVKQRYWCLKPAVKGSVNVTFSLASVSLDWDDSHAPEQRFVELDRESVRMTDTLSKLITDMEALKRDPETPGTADEAPDVRVLASEIVLVMHAAGELMADGRYSGWAQPLDTVDTRSRDVGDRVALDMNLPLVIASHTRARWTTTGLAVKVSPNTVLELEMGKPSRGLFREKDEWHAAGSRARWNADEYWGHIWGGQHEGLLQHCVQLGGAPKSWLPDAATTEPTSSEDESAVAVPAVVSGMPAAATAAGG